MTKGKILVTGGAGYIGSHTAVELLNDGYEVIIIDNLSNSNRFIIDRIQKITGKKVFFHQEDLLNFAKVEQIVSAYNNIKGIIHFAAYKAVGESVEKPVLYYENNIVSLLNVLKVMTLFGIPNLVFSSSCTVYGQPDILPVTEEAPIKKALSPYGNTKQIAEEIIADTVYANKNLFSIALRYFNPIGAHESALIGELPLGIPNNLVPFVTQTAYGLREELKIFGNDYNTPDGTAIRDYIHVVDLAKAHIVALNRMISGNNKESFEIFNIGTGNGNSVMEIVNEFKNATGLDIKCNIVGRREGDIEQVWADTSLANMELGWNAKIPLREMLSSAWNWEKAYRADSKQEKEKYNLNLEHFKNLMALGFSNNGFNAEEINFLVNKAKDVGISVANWDEWMKEVSSFTFQIPQNMDEREEYLADLVHLAMVDGKVHQTEYDMCLKLADKLEIDAENLDKIIKLIEKLWKNDA
jgi:UDP-glucose 4-epimerase